MTVKALEGTLQIPEVPPPEADVEDLGFGKAIPPGQIALSEFFYPNPDNEPGTALFNVFAVSIDYTGDVYLVKRPPSSSELMPKRKFRVVRADGSDVKLTLAPSEALCITVQEPENGVGYALAVFSETGGQTVHFRMSL